MSITQGEAIEILRKRQRYCKVIADHANETVKADELREVDAIDMAISALRPVSREQVEKAWRGEWDYPTCEWNLPKCPKCGCNSKDAMYGHKNNFCPRCGEAMTDEAVEMVLERVEAMHE